MSEQLNIDCDGCVGACCRQGTTLELTIQEASHMLKGGNKMRTLHQPVPQTQQVTISRIIGYTEVEGWPHSVVSSEDVMLTEGHGFYELEADCAFLDTSVEAPRCTAYDDRPGICRDFEAGELGCLTIRKARFDSGDYPDWQPVEITQKD